MFFVNELGVRVFVFLKLGGCEVVVSSSGIQDAASWLRKCLIAGVALCVFCFLVRFMCSQKSCSLLFFVVCSFLCFVYTSFLSLPLSLFSFFW